jgi:hypothetical protein
MKKHSNKNAYMKNVVLSFIIICLIIGGCKAKKNAETIQSKLAVQETPATEKSTGKISHQFRSTGCATVIVADIKKGETDTLIIIPKDALPSGFDVNGLKVFFNYHASRIPQPPGCSKGIPAEITNLEKK